MLKRSLVIIGLFLLTLSAHAASILTPYEQTEIAANKIFTSINEQSAAIKKNPEILKQIVRDDLIPDIHVKYAGALVLGNEYKNLTTEQRDEFFNVFEDYLVQAFAQALSMYNGQTFSVEAPKAIGDKTLVSVRVLLTSSDKNQQPIRLDFQWRKNTKTGEWQGYDMIAEGISMISTKQSEWATTLRQGGINALIKQLRTESQMKIDPDATIEHLNAA